MAAFVPAPSNIMSNVMVSVLDPIDQLSSSSPPITPVMRFCVGPVALTVAELSVKVDLVTGSVCASVNVAVPDIAVTFVIHCSEGSICGLGTLTAPLVDESFLAT